MTEQSPRRDALIAKVIGYLHKQLPEDQHQLISDFVTHYYAIVAYEDLQERSIMDLSGAILSHWHLIYQRQPGERKVRVFNPQYETDGWQSTHTIIDISQDDMPFLVDTARMEITRRGINIHFAIHPGGIRLVRNQEHRVIKVLPRDASDSDSKLEATIHFEINRQNEASVLNDIKAGIEKGLADVALSVKDWHAMSDHVREAIADLQKNPPSLPTDEIQEATKFLQWLIDDNFTFLGYREYELMGEGEKRALHLVPHSGLGVLSDTTNSQEYRYLSDMTEEVKTILLSPQVLIIAKTNTKATVHRNTFTDYIGVKRFNAQGQLIGERRFVGLFTSVAYHSNPQDIPFLRHKVTQVLKRSNINIKSHAGKALLNILETFPRDDLFQTDIEELTDISLGILHLQERSKVRLFVRKDIYGRYMSCLVYVPKDRYNTENRNLIEKILQRAFDGVEVSFSTMFGESVLARIHYVIRIDPTAKTPDYDLRELEQKLIEVTRLWRDELHQILLEHYGEERGTALYKTYEDAFPSSYRDDFEPRIGVADIKYVEKVLEGEKLCMGVYRPLTGSESNLHFKIFQANESNPLSDVIPIMENMGLRVLDERPYEVYLSDDKIVWINDFDMVLDRGEEL
ncbi:MAG: NAD-glutamate dehydrogenase, partial [Gammaproteobacteria bacterium]|nr:NAD-glutamate dehydrogenase [Gammaproteobacteria bacterium]